MMELMRSASRDMAGFLERCLEAVSDDWWQSYVLDRLSFQQQRFVTEQGYRSLDELDFAAITRLIDQNWHHVRENSNLPVEARAWIKELRAVRNKWAHLSASDLSPGETYRDIDTLGRFLASIGASEETIQAVDEAKKEALEGMTGAQSSELTEPQTSKAEQPATDETISGGATLFAAGDLVRLRSDPETLLPILTVDADGPEPQYVVFHENRKQTYFESQLMADETGKAEVDFATADELRGLVTSSKILSPSTANLFSMRAGRVNFVPYQYRPVLKLIRADRPRLLIADEVGVGKTIEAGLIIKELQARMDLRSILIICPKALVSERKWFTEMKRFDESFTALDGPKLRHCLRETDLDGEWPRQYEKAILPFSLFDSSLVFGPEKPKKRDEKGLLDLDPPPQFDLVIVDEAHHIRNPETYLHQGVKFLCDHAQAVLFLSATPVQLGREDLFTLLNVMRPDLVIDQPSFEQMAEPNRHIHSAAAICRKAANDWQHTAREELTAAADTEWGRLFIREDTEFQAAYDILAEEKVTPKDRVSLITQIEELYTFANLINRTRRRDIGEFTTRRSETVSVEFTPSQRHLHDEILNVIARILTRCHGRQNVKFMMTTIRRQSASCLFGLAPLLHDMLNRKLDQLDWLAANDTDTEADLGFINEVRADIDMIIELASSLDEEDPKLEAFIEVLAKKAKQPRNKVLVFSTFRHTLSYLDRHASDAGHRIGLIHGSIPDDARAELRKRFALDRDDPDAIDVLLSSEVGCEGLDFQFCDFMVNFDLPWNPMKIEQRIGRIDRYGQKSEAVSIVNFVTPGTVDADIYERCLMRIGVFRSAIGGSEEILGDITQQLHRIGEDFDLTDEERAERLQQLSDNSIRDVQEEEELETRQAELFGLNFPGQSWKREIQEAETSWLSPEALERISEIYLKSIVGQGTSGISGERKIKTLRLDREQKDLLLRQHGKPGRSSSPLERDWERWLKGTVARLSVTFDQPTAAENPEVVHLSVVHPLIRQAAQHCRGVEPLVCRLGVTTKNVGPGEYPFSIHAWSKSGIRHDETLVPICDQPELEEVLLSLLEEARDISETTSIRTSSSSRLNDIHHERWNRARAEHMEQNRQLAAQRIQSLTVSHRARMALLNDQIAKANDPKIHLMKTSEREGAEADQQRRLSELSSLSERADIRSQLIAYGVLVVEGGL